MSVLPEREDGIFQMASRLGYANLDVTHVLERGRTTGRREIGRLTIEVEYVIGLADGTRGPLDPARWYERRHVRIDYEGLRVFDAWEGRRVGSPEPEVGLVVDFLPGPWETRLANHWTSERSPS